MFQYFKKFFFNYYSSLITLLLFGSLIFISLISYDPNDPSFNLVTQKYPHNYLGYFGSYLADLLYQLLGIASFLVPLHFLGWALILLRVGNISWFSLKIIGMSVAVFALSVPLSSLNLKILPAGGGGVIGIIIFSLVEEWGILINIVLGVFALFLVALNIGISYNSYLNFAIIRQKFNIIKAYLPQLKPSINTEPKPLALKKAPLFNPQNEIISSSPNIDYSEISSNDMSEIIPKMATKFNQASKVLNNTGISPSLPPIDLLKMPDNQNIKLETSSELKTNAENLISVLSDFGVKGQIIDINQGPVVTLY